MEMGNVPKRQQPGMDFPDLCVYSIYVSNILRANGIILPVVELRRNEAMYTFNILNIFNGHRTEPSEMPCGSRAEGLAMLAGRADLSSSDEDVIIFANDFQVCEDKSEIEALCLSYPMSCPILRIPDVTCPGYAKLVLVKMSSKLRKFSEFKGRDYFLKNSLKERIADNFDRKYHCTFHGPAVKVELLSQTTTSSDNSEINSPKKFEFKNKDYVLCLKGQSWPVEAYEWKTRHRPSNWPPKKLFDNIIKSGYLLAGVGNKQSEESKIQWRVSFNRAEQLIIESFNETQVYCLILLRLLKNNSLSKLGGKSITSYTMKTIMFWSLDELPNSFWQPFNLLFCFWFCLKKLKLFVIEKFLPDYFIKERNHFISSEFTSDEQTRTEQFLNCFLEYPKENMHTLLYSYHLNNMHQNIPNPILEVAGQEMFIKLWLCIQISIAEDYHDLVENSFSNLYDGYNAESVLLRCNDVNKKLTKINYAQPFIKHLQNCMCVLQYMLLKKEKEKFGHITDSSTRRQCFDYMKSSLAADRTHTVLRVATCYLDEGANSRKSCIDLIRSVTDNSHLYMHSYSHIKKEQLEKCMKQAFDEMQPICKTESEIHVYEKIINHDLKYPNPYTTIKQFKVFKEQGNEVDWHSKFLLVWEGCWFDVTFMLAELPVLPKPSALELCTCVDNSPKYISFQPFLYGLLLNFLWHEKYGSGNSEKVSVLEQMKHCVSNFPVEKQFRGLNFISYCCSLQKDYRSASRYLIQSFNLNPIKHNVAYLYIKYILTLLRLACSNDNEDSSLWLNLLGIEWNID